MSQIDEILALAHKSCTKLNQKQLEVLAKIKTSDTKLLMDVSTTILVLTDQLTIRHQEASSEKDWIQCFLMGQELYSYILLNIHLIKLRKNND